MYARATQAYKNVYLESASPGRLIEEMYARLMRDIADGRAGMQARDAGARGAALGHAVDIVGALNAALDRRLAPDLCAQLTPLYDFVMQRLTRANMHDDVRALAEAEQVVSMLRDAFQKAAASL
jgi:flagellar protein FliS